MKKHRQGLKRWTWGCAFAPWLFVLLVGLSNVLLNELGNFHPLTVGFGWLSLIVGLGAFLIMPIVSFIWLKKEQKRRRFPVVVQTIVWVGGLLIPLALAFAFGMTEAF